MARLQRLAVAHIAAQEEMDKRLARTPETQVFGAEFLAGLRKSFH